MVHESFFRHLNDLREYTLEIKVGFAHLVDTEGRVVLTITDAEYLETLIGLGVTYNYANKQAGLHPVTATYHSEEK